MSSGSGSADAPAGGSSTLASRVGLDEARLEEMRAFFELGPEDTAQLEALRPTAERTVDGIVADFYAHLARFPPLRALLEEAPGRIGHLSEVQRAYFLSMMGARFDDAYVESRLRVGSAHQEIGLEPRWYIGAFALYLRLALRALVAETGDGARILPAVEALVKATCFDIALAMRTYVAGGFVAREVADQLRRAADLAEEALRARAETERLKDELAAMVVHDLKNPVSGIMMMVQVAQRKARNLPDTFRGYLQQIDLTCREMMRLIENLLEISKIEEGKMPIAREVVVLAELVDEVMADHQPLVSQAGRTLEIDVPTSLPPAVADRALLRRVLGNLLSNAVRHSGSETVWVTGTPGPGPGEVSLAVRDEGQGIPPAVHERIFEKFASLPRSAADAPFRDTGLGLPFCKLAVDEMGGRLTFATVPGGGTTFTVTLPVREAR